MDPSVDPEQMDLEEALLRAGRDVRMSPELRNKTLTALGVGAAVGLTTTSAAQASTLGWLSGKTGTIVIATGVAGALGVAGAVAFSGGATPSDDEASRASVALVDEAPRMGEPEVVEEPEVEAEPSVTGPAVTGEMSPPAETAKDATGPAAEDRVKPRASGSQRAPSSEASSLREELAHIARVEAALQEKNPARALTLLAEYRQRFPRPRLGLEAEVLTIQALSENGSSAAARKRAARFLEKYPSSPLGARAKRYLD